MASRTQIVCLCEGAKGSCVDEVFISKLMKTLKPNWVRPEGSNFVRTQPCGNRAAVIKRTATELRSCLSAGSNTTLMVWADCDDDCADPEALKRMFWKDAQQQGITKEYFERIVFIFAKDRIENWIEFLTTGKTDEAKEGPRVKHNRDAAEAARMLASMCSSGIAVGNLPPSLDWSCENWRKLVERMKPS